MRQGAGGRFSAHELVLEGLRRRAVYHPRPGEGGWEEVGEALAHPGFRISQ
jgi:hypothetical protein